MKTTQNKIPGKDMATTSPETYKTAILALLYTDSYP